MKIIRPKSDPQGFERGKILEVVSTILREFGAEVGQPY
jgi:hypothetical protein